MRARAWIGIAFVAACGGGKGTGTGTGAAGTSGGGQATGGDGQAAGSGGTDTSASVMPAPAGFAEADAISIEDGVIATWSFAGGKVTRLGEVKLSDPAPESAYPGDHGLGGDWSDRDHFFVRVPPRTVLMVTAKGITPVTVPPESAFETPRPAIDDENLEEGGGVMEAPGGQRFGLVVQTGRVYWSECAWGFPYDGWQCEVYVTAELWPDPEITTDNSGVRVRSWGWAGEKVSGFRTKELDEGRILGCTPPAGTAYKQTQLRGKEENGEMVHTAEWVSAKPPRLLVIWGTPGYSDLLPERWALHDGCLEKPLAQGELVEAGPAGLWIGDDVVYEGAVPLGKITGDVKFRPPA